MRPRQILFVPLLPNRYIRTRFMKFLEPLVVVTITVTVAFVAMFASNDCKPNGTEEQYQDTFGGPVKVGTSLYSRVLIAVCMLSLIHI